MYSSLYFVITDLSCVDDAKVHSCSAANGTRPPTAWASRSTKHANPCSKSLRWADIEQGRRGAASTMRGQDAKWALLILYAFAGFL
jgi:hypothetical protein